MDISSSRMEHETAEVVWLFPDCFAQFLVPDTGEFRRDFLHKIKILNVCWLKIRTAPIGDLLVAVDRL